MKKTGFYCRMYGKDCFIETDQTKRTKALALDFINKVQNKMNRFSNISEANIEYIQKNMTKARFLLRTFDEGKLAGLGYYDISGENFSWGCDPCENPMEHCIVV